MKRMILVIVLLLAGCSGEKEEYFRNHYDRDLTKEEYIAEYCSIIKTNDELEGTVRLIDEIYDLDSNTNIYKYTAGSDSWWSEIYIESNLKLFDNEEARTIIKYEEEITRCINPESYGVENDIYSILKPTFEAKYTNYEIDSINYYKSNKENYNPDDKIIQAYSSWKANKSLYDEDHSNMKDNSTKPLFYLFIFFFLVHTCYVIKNWKHIEH